MSDLSVTRGFGKGPWGKVTILLGALMVLAGAWAGVRAQSRRVPPKSLESVPPRPAKECCGYPFPRSMDAEIADSDVHRVLYEDNHVMFLEVSNPPLLDSYFHGHPFASVFAHDSNTGPKNPDAPTPGPGENGPWDPKSPFNDMGNGSGAPPKGMQWPTCDSSAPQAPHRPYNGNMAPNHFFRLEFLHLDDDLQATWKEKYPNLTTPAAPVKDITRGPALGPNMSEQWPYPAAYDSIVAAPNNYTLRYEDRKIRLVEVSIRPGETTPMHGHPYPAALAYNAINDPKAVTETRLDPASPLDGQTGGMGKPPSTHNLKVPVCQTMAPQAPHKQHNGGTTPLHYYRIEFKRIDGDGLLANWRKWYPWMQYMQNMR